MNGPDLMGEAPALRGLYRLLHEVEALAEADAGARGSLRDIAQASAELRGALSRVVPAIQELEVRVDMGLDERAGTDSSGFDALELDRYGHAHELCRELKERASDLQGLQAQLEGSRRMLDSSLVRRGSRLRGLREAIRHVVPGDAAAMLDALRAEAAASADWDGVTLEIDGELPEEALEPKAVIAAAVLLDALVRSVARGARGDAPAAAAADLALGLEVVVEPGDLVLKVRSRDGLDVSRLDPAAPAEQPEAVSAARAFLRELRRAGARTVRDNGRLELRIPGGAGERALLFVRAGEQKLALPMDRLSSVLRLADVGEVQAGRLDLAGGTSVPTVDLGAIGGQATSGNGAQQRRYAALIGAPAPTHALLFDAIDDSARTRVIPLADPLPRLGAALGAAMLDDGRSVMVLDPGAAAAGIPAADRGADTAVAQAPRVLVVDDSVTIRKVSERILTRNHLRVQLARDGREALAQLLSARPDLILLDIEMPRMNGFEFLEALRADASFSDIPVIMISSRTGEKHRQQAATLGVRTFLGKPFKERELLAAMQEILEWQP